jgi:hypothetical protein
MYPSYESSLGMYYAIYIVLEYFNRPGVNNFYIKDATLRILRILLRVLRVALIAFLISIAYNE